MVPILLAGTYVAATDRSMQPGTVGLGELCNAGACDPPLTRFMRAPTTPLRGELAVVRRATQADADLLVQWHHDPEVARYWDHETFTHEEMLLRLARPEVDAYIVEAGEEPVGYLQAWYDGEPGSGGLDMFLIPEARGRGVGPDAARTLAGYLLANGQTQVTVDPYLWNQTAIRAWLKAGFRSVEEREPDDEHTASWLLMVFDPATPI